MAAVLVHIDLDGDRPHPSSLAALAAGRLVASSWGATLYAAVIARDLDETRSPESTGKAVTMTEAPGFEELQPALSRAGADKLVIALSDVAVTPLWASVGTAWQGVLDHLRPRLVLFGADAPSAIEVAPRTGAKIGARLLVRAKAIGVEDVELRDRDGGYLRSSDGGAAVALIGHAPAQRGGDDVDIDIIMLALPGGGDDRVELAGVTSLAVADAGGAVVVLGDDAAGTAGLAEGARALADRLGARLLKSRTAPGEADGTLERGAALAPELCVQIGSGGAAAADIAGASTLVQLGPPGPLGTAGKSSDAAIAGAPAEIVDELVRRLDRR